MGPMIDEVAEKGKKVEEKTTDSRDIKYSARKIEVAHQGPESATKVIKMKAEGVSAWFGTKQALFDVNMTIHEKEVTAIIGRSEEHTSELQSLRHLVCRL